MVEKYCLNKNSVYYYDIEEKTIARFPSKSNLKSNGSDNSLYFGNKDNEIVQKVFCSIFGANTIDDISGIKYKMTCFGDKVDVETNINADGQVQIKILKNGSMYKITNNYMLNEMRAIDFTKMLIVVDFNKNEIRFKDPNELKL